MKIILSPVRVDDELVLVKSGMTLFVNDIEYDFSRMIEGDILPLGSIESDWFTDDVKFIDGQLELVIRLPLPWNYSKEQAFPDPVLCIDDGIVELPKPLPADF